MEDTNWCGKNEIINAIMNKLDKTLKFKTMEN